MTKAEKDAIRARLARYLAVYGDNEYDLTGIAMAFADDVGALLDALEEAEAHSSYLEAQRAEWMKACDHWKARAEALERALPMKRPGHHETRCYACVHHSKRFACRAKTPCHDGSQWQFDEARFSKQEVAE